MKPAKGQDKQVANMQCSNTTQQHQGASRVIARKIIVRKKKNEASTHKSWWD